MLPLPLLLSFWLNLKPVFLQVMLDGRVLCIRDNSNANAAPYSLN